MATQICFIFTPKIGEDEPILTSIFFKGVGSTANQFFFSDLQGLLWHEVDRIEFESTQNDLICEDINPGYAQ